MWSVHAELWRRGNRVPFKGILRFLDHYPCGDGRKKLHSKRGGRGLVAVRGSLTAGDDPGDTVQVLHPGTGAGKAPPALFCLH